MSRRFFRNALGAREGAVAASYAIALAGLTAAIGIGYDYAQVATLDTELQNAADQAALAAATQLDGSANAITHAQTAAQNLVTNRSIMATGSSNAIAMDLQGFAFFATKADAEADTNPVTDPTKAKFVKVSVVSRQTHYALTPITGYFLSPSIAAKATAGLGSSLCKVPPILMCNPAETTDPSFTVANYIGKGLRLIATSGNNYAPGNFGYINVGGGTSGSAVQDLKQAIGWTTAPGGCVGTDSLTTKPGVSSTVTDALNTRFDIYDNNSCPTGGSCPPSINSVKDVVRPTNAGSGQCGTQGQGWQLPSPEYIPDSTTRLPPKNSTPQNMGHPRDICHAVSATGDCPNGSIGDGNWDRATYFSVNYPGFDWQTAMTTAYGTTSVTRYQVYRWEIAHANDVYSGSNKIGDPRNVSNNGKGNGNGNTLSSYPTPVCQLPGVNPNTAGTDRRTFPVAVVNCTAAGINGSTSNVPVLKYVNVFLVQPSLNRKYTSQSDVYVELVDNNTVGNSTAGSEQLIRHDKPYLVK